MLSLFDTNNVRDFMNNSLLGQYTQMAVSAMSTVARKAPSFLYSSACKIIDETILFHSDTINLVAAHKKKYGDQADSVPIPLQKTPYELAQELKKRNTPARSAVITSSSKPKRVYTPVKFPKGGRYTPPSHEEVMKRHDSAMEYHKMKQVGASIPGGVIGYSHFDRMMTRRSEEAVQRRTEKQRAERLEYALLQEQERVLRMAEQKKRSREAEERKRRSYFNRPSVRFSTFLDIYDQDGATDNFMTAWRATQIAAQQRQTHKQRLEMLHKLAAFGPEITYCLAELRRHALGSEESNTAIHRLVYTILVPVNKLLNTLLPIIDLSEALACNWPCQEMKAFFLALCEMPGLDGDMLHLKNGLQGAHRVWDIVNGHNFAASRQAIFAQAMSCNNTVAPIFAPNTNHNNAVSVSPFAHLQTASTNVQKDPSLFAPLQIATPAANTNTNDNAPQTDLPIDTATGEPLKLGNYTLEKGTASNTATSTNTFPTTLGNYTVTYKSDDSNKNTTTTSTTPPTTFSTKEEFTKHLDSLQLPLSLALYTFTNQLSNGIPDMSACNNLIAAFPDISTVKEKGWKFTGPERGQFGQQLRELAQTVQSMDLGKIDSNVRKVITKMNGLRKALSMGAIVR